MVVAATLAVLMNPNPAAVARPGWHGPGVGDPGIVQVCVNFAFVDPGAGICARLSALLNSIRRLNVTFSLIRKMRPTANVSLGRRCCR